ncbi:MAG TPA: tetratricopeptide repeat protein, partial [Anaeromyxobacteraceae bacterium]|nr:tetratricopeptide repeat protein [Anaeromyxobacteraceae bacterium]
ATATATPTATATATATATPPPTPPTSPATSTATSPRPFHSDARGWFDEGVRRDSLGDLAGAAEAFERAFAADASLTWAAVNAGSLRERLGDDAGALALYARVLDASPDVAPAARNMARLRVRRGETGAAEKDLWDRIGRSPDSVGLRVALADALLAEGSLDRAEEESRRVLKTDEKNVAAMVNLATVYHRRNRHELAKMVLENARQVDARDPAVWNRLGFVELALGNRPQSLEDFKTAASLRADYPEAHANYGAMLADAEDFEGAVLELELAVKYAPRSAAAWLTLGNAYRGTQKFEKAEAAYRKAEELDPALVDVQYDLAVLYLDGDRPGLPALQRLEQAVSFFDAYDAKGGKDPRLGEYRKDALKAIDREKKRLAREEKDRLVREAEAQKKEEEARREAEAAAQKAAEEAQKAPSAAGAPARPAPAPDAAAPTSTSAPAAAPSAASTAAAAPTATSTPAAIPSATPAGDSTAAARPSPPVDSPAADAPASGAVPGEERGDR